MNLTSQATLLAKERVWPRWSDFSN